MNANVSNYKNDFDILASLGDTLFDAIQYACFPDEMKEVVKNL